MARTAADDLLMERYLFVKEVREALVAEHHEAKTRLAALRRLLDAAGEGAEDGPLCCQRYSRLHHPAFSVRGCRWYGWTPPASCCGRPGSDCTGRCAASYAEVGPVDTAPLLALVRGQGAPPA